MLLHQVPMEKNIVQQIHSMSHIDGIYVFCGNTSRHKSWASKWSKIKGVYDCIELICSNLQQTLTTFHEDETPMSFVKSSDLSSSTDLNRLDPSFMYTKLFKDILLNMEHNQQSLEDFCQHCRKMCADNPSELKIIDEFSDLYSPERAIRWYTRSSFIFETINQSLRLLQGDMIVTMGFFIKDLHCQLEQLHKKQIEKSDGVSFILYRGQGLSLHDFDKLQQTCGGLMSFNNFLSTSRDRSVSSSIC